MDAETAQSREQGCWDPATFVKPFLARWTSDRPTPDWVVDDDWLNSIVHLGFGAAATPANVEFWSQTLRDVYKGDEARRRLKMATICLVERDGLIFRLPYVQCPVHWLHVSARVPSPFTCRPSGGHGRSKRADASGDSGYRGSRLQQDDPRGADQAIHRGQGDEARHPGGGRAFPQHDASQGDQRRGKQISGVLNHPSQH